MRLTRSGVWVLFASLMIGQTAFADFLVYHIGGKGGSSSGGAGGRSGPPGGAMMGAPGGGPGGGPPSGPPGGRGGPRRQAGQPGSSDRSGSSGRIILQGKVTVNSGKTVTYEHPTFKEKLYFSLDDVSIYKAPTLKDEFVKILSRAGKDPEELMKAAVFALKKGMLREFYGTVDKVLAQKPDHEAAKRVKAIKAQIEEPLPDNPETEKKLRAAVRRSNMSIAQSKHYLLLHDTPPTPLKGHSKNRAEERLELLEKVYESFLQLFYAQDIELDIPKERLMVVLFNQQKDYQDYANALSPNLGMIALGFWSPINNVAVFYDQGTGDDYEVLNESLKALRKRAEDAKKDKGPGAADLIRMSKTLELLVAVDKENADIKTVSHECTHQMAGNTGLLPRHVDIPKWVHEGLATYFEAPGEATWAGIGAVNELRLSWYNGLESDRVHSNIKFIATDQIFDFARTHGAVVHGYGQAWALTHFLMENHVKEFVTFYRMLGEMPAATPINPDLLFDLFTNVFGKDLGPLDQDWRSFMRNLKTDMERQAPELVEDVETGSTRSGRRK